MWLVVIAMIYLAVLTELVKPNSPGPLLITTTTDVLIDLVKGIEGVKPHGGTASA